MSMHVGSDRIEVELLPELGGRLHRLRAFGHDLLRTPPGLDAYEREPFFWGSFVMAPWCNRTAAGPIRVGNHSVALAPNFADGTAIHGQVQALPWEAVADGALRVAGGGDGWPWRYEVEQRIVADGAVLRLDLTLVNRAKDAMPAGIGIHPWFVRPLEIRVPAHEVFGSNVASTSLPEPVEGAHDLRTLRAVPTDLDATWLLRGSEPLLLRWPDAGLSATLRVAAAGAYLCAASPANLDGIAVEPQTHAPDGLRRLVHGEPGGLTMLSPGGSLQLHVELAFQDHGGA